MTTTRRTAVEPLDLFADIEAAATQRAFDEAPSIYGTSARGYFNRLDAADAWADRHGHFDSNARAGRPSQGLMQCIPSTFRAYVLPEFAHLPITNPVANITAGVRYMVANYGLTTLLQGGRLDAMGRYLGY